MLTLPGALLFLQVEALSRVLAGMLHAGPRYGPNQVVTHRQFSCLPAVLRSVLPAVIASTKVHAVVCMTTACTSSAGGIDIYNMAPHKSEVPAAAAAAAAVVCMSSVSVMMHIHERTEHAW